MGELIHFSRDPRDRKPTENNKMIEIPTDIMADKLAKRRREHIRALPQLSDQEEILPITSQEIPGRIEAPDTFIIPGSREATLGTEAIKAVSVSMDNGRFGLGKVEVGTPADPSKVPGWNGETRR